MDHTVPSGALMLLDLIGDTETARKPPEAYGVILGHMQGRLPKPLTSYTLDELLAAQKVWASTGWSVNGRKIRGSASGRYQIIRKTLLGLVAELGLDGKLPFDAAMQDRLGYHLLLRRQFAEFMAQRLSVVAFGKLLAQEWASFPVLNDTQGAHRNVRRGQSYYAGDGINKALLSPDRVEALLLLITEKPVQGQKPPAATPTPANDDAPPASARMGLAGYIIAGVIALGAAVLALFQNGATP